LDKKLEITAQVNFSGPIFSPQILVIFKIKNLAKHNCVKDWVKVAPGSKFKMLILSFFVESVVEVCKTLMRFQKFVIFQAPFYGSIIKY